MTRRGRPPHPDVLTPREWEVLGLVREGLANEEIAQRLGISVGGVKYHVSEILGKLGLDNRADAARWQPGQARRWWAALGAPLAWRPRLGWLSAALAGGVALAVAAGIGVLVWALATTDSAPGEAPASVEEAYELMLAAVDRPGSILHTTIQAESRAQDDAGKPVGTRLYAKDLWIDTESEVLREEFHKDPAWVADLDVETVAIYAKGSAYIPDDPGEALRSEVEEVCPESPSSAIALMLECVGRFAFHLPDVAAELEFGTTYDGREAFAIVSTRVSEGEADHGAGTTVPTRTLWTLYVDSDKLLPLARVTESYLNDELEITFIATYAHEFVAPESLPEAFFDPRSIGYGLDDVAAQLDLMAQEAPVYWFGEELEPAGEIDPIVLTRIDLTDALGARHLYYETPNGIPALWVFHWTPEEWGVFLQSPQGRLLSDRTCVQRSELPAGDRTATVYTLAERDYPISDNPMTTREVCERRVAESELAEYRQIVVIDCGDVVVDVRADVVGSHDSPEALLALLAELRPR